MSKKLIYLLGLLSMVLLFGCNEVMLVTDSVESNYALTAKEMVLSGDWVSPQIYGNYWFDKPVFFYWLTALGYKLFGINEFASRFFPALFGLSALVLIAWGGKKLYNNQGGIFSAFILASTVEFFLISKSVITDATLFTFFSGALLFYYLGYSSTNKNYYYGTYAFCALATLTKGPIGFLLPGLIICLFIIADRGWASLKQAKLFTGSILFLLIATPWYYQMYAIHGSAFLDMFLGTHNFLRATVSEHPRDNVIYYYTLVTLLAFFPWVGFLPQVVKDCFKPTAQWQKPPSKELFLLIWTVTIFIFFQSMATKYLTYTYPMLFPLSLLLGGYLSKKMTQVRLGGILLYNFAFYLFLVAAAIWAERFEGIGVRSIWLLILIIVLGMAYGLYSYLKGNKESVLASMMVTAIAFNFCLVWSVAVPMTQLRSAKEVAVALDTDYPTYDTVYCFSDYPTSAVFYSNKRIVKVMAASDVAGFKPAAFSWSIKNIMPYATFEEALATKQPVTIVKEKNYKDFLQVGDKQWQTVNKKGGWYILQRQENK
ncbi:MAG: glycosyltransferase family 39 protein [Acidaminococcaceae bacterium]